MIDVFVLVEEFKIALAQKPYEAIKNSVVLKFHLIINEALRKKRNEASKKRS